MRHGPEGETVLSDMLYQAALRGLHTRGRDRNLILVSSSGR